MLYSEIIAVCSQIHIKHINTLCGQNVDFFLTLQLLVHIVTTGVWNITDLPLISKLSYTAALSLPPPAPLASSSPPPASLFPLCIPTLNDANPINERWRASDDGERIVGKKRTRIKVKVNVKKMKINQEKTSNNFQNPKTHTEMQTDEYPTRRN